jgi:hypothetical protein
MLIRERTARLTCITGKKFKALRAVLEPKTMQYASLLSLSKMQWTADFAPPRPCRVARRLYSFFCDLVRPQPLSSSLIQRSNERA